METKKHPRADVRRNSSIYFAVGLVLMLLAANYSINYRTYDRVAIVEPPIEYDNPNDLKIPITNHPAPPPPEVKPPIVPDEIVEVDDDTDIKETIIDTSEDDTDEPIVDVADVVVEEDPIEPVDVPFVSVEHVPEFPGCNKGDNEAKRNCMSKKITKHVQKKFDSDLASELGLSGKQTIRVVFKIDKTGNIVGVQSRAPHPRLEKEAARVINLLPKMKPGKQRGEAVTVSYSLPIVFQVEN
ncbi:energy transducer TonB [Pontimicrobium aquaticum]|uniref:Energy transducer TonB n=1 Tax=Pontimicrobium aquaticum TaxID=2565367 RepID=A0A4U0EQD3_9FLAO|nr:energy transducer TonB [Pontimicrobium aquaticum]TJY32532.1 energy transducer TonB [Pontimicrobium aquaticum]